MRAGRRDGIVVQSRVVGILILHHSPSRPHTSRPSRPSRRVPPLQREKVNEISSKGVLLRCHWTRLERGQKRFGVKEGGGGSLGGSMVGGQRGDVLVITVGIRGCRSMVRDDRRNVTLQGAKAPHCTWKHVASYPTNGFATTPDCRDSRKFEPPCHPYSEAYEQLDSSPLPIVLSPPSPNPYPNFQRRQSHPHPHPPIPVHQADGRPSLNEPAFSPESGG